MSAEVASGTEETYREDLQGVAADVVLVTTTHVMYANEQTVVHDAELLQELRVSPELLRQKRTLFWTELERLVTVDPVEILQRRAWVLACTFFRVLPPNRRSLQVISLVDVPMGREEVVHDDEVDLVSVRELNAVQSIKSAEQRMRVRLDMVIVQGEDSPEELVLVVMDRLDDEAVISREVEERSRFAGRAQLGEDVLRRQTDEVVCRVEEEEVFPEFPEHPGRVVLELEIVLRGWRQLVPNAMTQ